MMNFSCRYAMVFDPQIKLGVSERKVFATLTTSRKDNRTNPPSYHRSTWYDVEFVGDALEPAKALHGGEKIDVIRGAVTHEKNTKTGKSYYNFVVFEFTLSEDSTRELQDEEDKAEDE